MRTPTFLPDVGSIVPFLLLALGTTGAVVTASRLVAWYVGQTDERRQQSRAPRRAVHAFAEATAAGCLEIAERELARVLSRNDR